MTEHPTLDGRLRAYLDDLTAETRRVTISERLAGIPSATRVSRNGRRRLIAAGAGLVTAAAVGLVLAITWMQRGGGNASGPAALSTMTPHPSTPATASPAPASAGVAGPSFAPTMAPKQPPPAGVSVWSQPVAVDEVGLRPGQVVLYTVSGQFSGGDGCTDGSQPPSGAATTTGAGSATLTLTADARGEASGMLYMEPPAPRIACPQGQHGEYYSAQWTNVVVVDTANGISETVPGMGGIAN